MDIYISLHVLRDLLQVVDEVLLVFVDLASFFGDDAGIDVERLIERDGDEVLVGQDSLARKVEQMPRSTRFLMVCRYGEKWMTRGLQLCAV